MARERTSETGRVPEIRSPPTTRPTAPVGPRGISPWLPWSAAAAWAVFASFVALPSMFVLWDLVAQRAASLTTRLDAFRLLEWPVVDPSAYVDDPWMTGLAAFGLLAGLVGAALLVYLAVLLIRRGRSAWPDSICEGGYSYEALQVALMAAMIALAVQSAIQPLPARPVGWWFLAIALAAATAWLAQRRPGLAPAVTILCGSVVVSLLLDAVGPTGGLRAPGSTWEILAAASVVVATGASLAGLTRDRLGEMALRDNAGMVAARMIVGSLLAVALGLLVIVISAAGFYDSPQRVIAGDPSRMHVVVLAPHIDDEAAFAGETIAWLAERGADVTVVYTTDSRGGRALDRQRGYVAARRVAASRAAAILGVHAEVTLGDVRDGDRMAADEKSRRIEADLADGRLVPTGTVLIAVAGPGHPDHEATYRAACATAARLGLPLYVAWSYDRHHELVGSPRAGEPAPIAADAEAQARKAAATDTYIDMYQDGWPFTLPRVLLAARGRHDVLSVERHSQASAPRARTQEAAR